MLILKTVAGVFENFACLRLLHSVSGSVLEFSAEAGELGLMGVDILEYNAADRIATSKS